MAAQVGMMIPGDATTDHARRAALLDAMATAGLDHVAVGDHVSFHVGFGVDGLVLASMLLGMHPTLPVVVAVYLLPLRHPVLVARQLATAAELAPGRLTLGVGLGGEDRHECEVCGVDPSTRGRRADESLAVLRPLLAGESVTHRGEHFDLDRALVLPAPDPPVPIVVGGRSDAALARAGRHGDGWLGIWVDAERYARSVAAVDDAAEAAGRRPPVWRHGLTVWVGFGEDRAAGERAVAPTMESVYQLPFERFRRHVPCGTPAEVADALAGHADAGCTSFTLIARADDPAAAVDGVAAVKALLA